MIAVAEARKYVFTKDFTTQNYIPQGAKAVASTFTFKEGDIVQGTFQPNSTGGDPMGWVVFSAEGTNFKVAIDRSGVLQPIKRETPTTQADKSSEKKGFYTEDVIYVSVVALTLLSVSYLVYYNYIKAK